jgi:alpha-galactosidase
MTLPTKIAVIGAGSASFGENTLAAILRSEKLRGSYLALVDHNTQTLDIIGRLAERMNQEWGAGLTISLHNRHQEALPGAAFVVSAIEVGPREALWRTDYEIPLKYGVRQPYAENGGPGGFAHAARNIGPILEIAHAMEQACPDAWLINFTNPMVRICDAVHRYSRVKVVGLCHQILIGYCLVGMALSQDLGLEVPPGITSMDSDPVQIPLRRAFVRQVLPRLEIVAAGLNHFTWVLSLQDRETGEDLYPLFRRQWAEMRVDFEPLTRRVFDAFGWFPVPGDSHLCEYLPWVSDPATKPWEKFHLHLYNWDEWARRRDSGLVRLAAMADGKLPLEGLLGADSEGALEVIEHVAGGESHLHLAANRPNQGQISNLPEGAIVETPVTMDAAGIHAQAIGTLPEGIAELLRREIAVGQLNVDAAVTGDRQLALQCLLMDPVIRDLDVARLILDDYLKAYRYHLPQFWA